MMTQKDNVRPAKRCFRDSVGLSLLTTTTFSNNLDRFTRLHLRWLPTNYTPRSRRLIVRNLQNPLLTHSTPQGSSFFSGVARPSIQNSLDPNS